MNFRIIYTILASAFLLLAVPIQSKANDTVASVAAGGIQFQTTDDISMEEEHLFISLDKVEVRYLFRNHSNRDITTTVAFPVPEYEFQMDSILTRYPSDFSDFLVQVNGKEIHYDTTVQALVDGKDYAGDLERLGISVRDFGEFEKNISIDSLNTRDRETLQHLGVIGGIEPDWPNWTVKIVYHWQQTFPANQTVEIFHSYSPYYGGPNSGLWQTIDEISEKACLDNEDIALLKLIWPREMRDKWEHPPFLGMKYVPYILTTGKNWKGPIGKFQLDIDFPEGNIASTCFPKPPASKEPGKKIYKMKDFAPAADFQVYFFTIR